MDPVNPWLDPSEVRHLAEQLLRPVPPARITAADPGFAAAFVGFISAGEPETTEPPPPAAEPPPSASNPEPPASQPAAEPPPRFLNRIQILRDWLAENFQATDIFILDHRGKVIFKESDRVRLHLIARNFSNIRSRTGDIRVKIGPGAILELIPCDTQRGRIILGALVPEGLPASHILAITEVLIQAASPA